MEIESSAGPKDRANGVEWKKLYGHIFKPPQHPQLFACVMGAGTQIFMCFYLCLNAFFFFFTINSLRHPIFIIIMSVTACFGFINGLVTTRVLKFFGTTDWALAAAIASLSLPAFMYCCFGLEICLKAIAGGYAPGKLLKELALTVIWCLVNGGSCLFGAYKGYMLKRVKVEVK